ncbi:hypothetical protein GFM29_15405 [Rhizobium leguminosarum bv. viciae]|nr:hypothetical protein [Rhizobium leguminosarum bv. viciae]
MANATLRLGEAGAACPFAPFTGRRCRQADEGPASAISRAVFWIGVRQQLSRALDLRCVSIKSKMQLQCQLRAGG